MLTFNPEQPFLQKDMVEKVQVEKQGIIDYYSKMFKCGIIFLFTGIVAIYFFGLDWDRKSDPYHLKFITFIMWEFLVVFLIMIPLMFKPRILALIESPYLQASEEKIHDCNAFLIMPGMEKYKEYADNVRNQGRELTYMECNEIIKYWNTLAKK